MRVAVVTASYEADPQVVAHALEKNLVPVTGDSDLLAYGPPNDDAALKKLVVVKKYGCDLHRVIDLEATTKEGC